MRNLCLSVCNKHIFPTIQLIYFIIGRSIAEDPWRCSVEFGAETGLICDTSHTIPWGIRRNQIKIGLVQQLAVVVVATYCTTVRKIQILRVKVKAKSEHRRRHIQLLFSILHEVEVRFYVSVNCCMLANISLKA